MSSIDGFIDYERREYCKDIGCPIQQKLNALPEDSDEYNILRLECKNNCKHTTYEFHHWLINNGYLLVRK